MIADAMNRKHFVSSFRSARHVAVKWVTFAVCLTVLPIGFAAGPVQNIEYHVAPDGSDGGSGSAGDPFATIVRARDAVRTDIAADAQGSITVFIHEGTYRITEPIVLGLADSGNDSLAISYRAFPGDAPVVSGGQPVSGWTVQPDGTWNASVPPGSSFRELFVDGVRRPRARHPNSGFANVAFAKPDQRTTFEFHDSDLPPQADLSGAELVFLHDWSITRVDVASVDHEADVLTTTDPIGPPAAIWGITYFTDHPRYFVENAQDLIDIPGEWYLDEQSRTLTYKPFAAESPAATEFINPVATDLFVVRGDFATETPVRNVHIEGLTFEHSRWNLPDGGFAEYQAGFYQLRDPADDGVPSTVITFEQVESCSLTDCVIRHAGGWGVTFGRSAVNCTMHGNVISDVAGNGLLIGEHSFRNIGGVDWWVVEPEQAAFGNDVRNNVVERCGQVFFGCVGVWVGLSNNNILTHNLIRHLPYTGMSVGVLFDDEESPCHDNVIERNHIHHVMQVMADGGGIYTLGRQPGTMLIQNLVHSIPESAGSGASVGVFCDQGSTSISVSSNAFHSIDATPVKFNFAGANTVINNIFILAGGTVGPIAFSNMNPAKVTVVFNATSTMPHVTCEHFVYDSHGVAGLEPSYLTSLIETPAADGCESCDGVAYTGLSLNACGTCNTFIGICTIPAVSAWGMLAAVMLLYVVASVVFRKRAAVVRAGVARRARTKVDRR